MAYLFHEKVVFQSFQLKLNMFPRWVDPQFDDVEESPDIPPHPQQRVHEALQRASEPAGGDASQPGGGGGFSRLP